jgi:hypothetical protein
MRIINPWTIYWISRLDIIQGVALIILILSVASLAAAILLETDWNKFPVKYKRWLVIAIVASALVAMFIPDEKTAIEMVLADKITYEAVEDAYGKIEESAERIIEVMKEED